MPGKKYKYGVELKDLVRVVRLKEKYGDSWNARNADGSLNEAVFSRRDKLWKEIWRRIADKVWRLTPENLRRPIDEEKDANGDFQFLGWKRFSGFKSWLYVAVCDSLHGTKSAYSFTVNLDHMPKDWGIADLNDLRSKIAKLSVRWYGFMRVEYKVSGETVYLIFSTRHMSSDIPEAPC